MKQLNYLAAVTKSVKEGEENKLEQAKKNGPILKKKLEAKVSVLEGREMEAQIRLEDAEEGLEKAVGSITTDIERWVSLVKSAEDVAADAAQELKDVQDSIEWHKEKIKMFETKK